jgi:uncharacterized protein YyaL (SSP411 family)
MNHLKNETSPYLLQHMHNPVDWYPWGNEALEKAAKENKPILVSIGYAACHWCHVMEKESFEDEETAHIMNQHFVNIKIDREERPDLDHVYMDAVQAMTGSGGWPLNVFLTPSRKPFYGGTYFPPVPVHSRPSWKEVLLGVSRAYRERQEEMEAQANSLTEHLVQSNNFGISAKEEELKVFTRENCQQMFESIMNTADRREGGFGGAPKFPQTFTIQFLLHHYYYMGEKQAMDQAILSLKKMIRGGIYDQLGGGFARYSTDAKWLAPHFEKMLYDNALLVMSMAEAFQLTGEGIFQRAIEETLVFVKNEMSSEENGFYSALDADSEGVEGKFYVWSRAEVEEVLGEDSELFCTFYDITEKGNWEETNILHIEKPLEEFAEERNMRWEDLELSLQNSKTKLIQRRNSRIRPLLDDKILLGWNALMNSAYSKAFAATGKEEYRELAIANMKFLLDKFRKADGGFYHTYKNGEAKNPAFLDDLACLVQALIHLQEITGDAGYLKEARSITEMIIRDFSEENNFFYFTANGQHDIIVRKKEVFDGAVPSGNSVMAWNLYALGTIFDIPRWKERSVDMIIALRQAIIRHSGSFANWASLLQAISFGIPEIAIVGENKETVCNEFLRTFIPFRVFQSSTLSNTEFPLLTAKPHSMKPLIFLCKNYSCQNPVTEVDALIGLLRNV